MPDKTALVDIERARIAARLGDMCQTLGERDFEPLIRQATAQLRALSDHAHPWSSTEAQRGLNVALLLGLDRLELACRAILDEPSDKISTAAAKAAGAAAQALAELRWH